MSSTPKRSASASTASGKSSPSVSITNPIASPPFWQPKQWNSFSSAFTENDGVRSSWKGHSPVQRVPTRRRSVSFDTSATMSIASRRPSIDSCV